MSPPPSWPLPSSSSPASAVVLASDLYLGYAYDENGIPPTYFPSPWQGDPNVNFVGERGQHWDGGAIRIDNGTTSPTSSRR